MSDGLSMSFSPESLSEIARFAGMATMLSANVQAAMTKGADIIIAASQGNMHWQNPTGRLEGSMRRMTESPYEIDVGSDLPYARRRELGFHGRDTRDRLYDDEGAFFLTKALNDHDREILVLLDTAVESAWNG